MADNKNHDEKLENIMNQLADSVVEVSDEEIIAEIRESGSDPQKEAEDARAVLQQASQVMEAANKRLWDLGHTIDPNCWQRKERSYHNICLDCGLLASFATATNEIRGDAFGGPCSGSNPCTVRRQEATGR